MPRNCRSNKATPAHIKVNNLIIAEVERLGNLLINLEKQKQKQEHDFKIGELLIVLLKMGNMEEGNKKQEFAEKQRIKYNEYFEATKKYLVYKILLWKNLLNKELHKFYNKRQYKKITMEWNRTSRNWFEELPNKYKNRTKWEAKMFEELCKKNAKTHYQLENRKNCILHYWKRMN